MKKTLSIMMMLLAVLAAASALDISVTRDYPEVGFTIREEGKPEFTVDSSIWKANTLGYRISSITKHVWELTDGTDRIIVALGGDDTDILALRKHLDRNKENLTLFISMNTEIPGRFFIDYNFANVAMQSYTPEVMRALRATQTLYYPVKFTDTIRVKDGRVDYISEQNLGRQSVEVKANQGTPAGEYEEVPVPAVDTTVGGRTIIVICPHCGEQITIKI